METYSSYEGGETTNLSMPSEQYQGEEQNTSWLPEAYQGGIFEKFKTPEDLCQSYQNLNSLLSKRLEDFSHQDKEAFLQMRQEVYDIPSDPSEYQIDISPIRDGSENLVSEDELDYIKNMSSALGLNNEQAQLQYDLINQFVGECSAQNAKQLEDHAINNGCILGEMWGEKNARQAIADVASGISVAAKAIGCSEEALKAELAYPMGELCSPNLLNLFRNLSQFLGSGKGHGLSVGVTPVDAGMQLDHYRNSADFKKAMGYPEGSPEYMAAIERVKALANMKYGRR